MDGQKVVRGAALQRAISSATDSMAFLAGGWVGFSAPACLAFRTNPIDDGLLPPCGAGYGLTDGAPGTTWVSLIEDPRIHYLGPAVFRVHVHDPRAAGCTPANRARCERALVVDGVVWIPGTGAGDPRSAMVDAAAGRFGDGLPRSIAGQLVVRGPGALTQAEAATTDAAFLVGVWLDVYTGPRSLPVCGLSSPSGSWLHACPSGITPSDAAGSGGSVLDPTTTTFKFATGLHSGPAVLEVHVHDARSSQCGSDAAACDRMIVVDRAVWAGDALSDPDPLTVKAVQAALHQADPATTLTALGDADLRTEPGLPDAQTLDPRSNGPGDLQLAGVYVLPSIEAERAALPNVQPGTAGSALPAAIHWTTSRTSAGGGSYSFTARWLVVENVALSVFTLPVLSAADREYLGKLQAALVAAL